MFELEANLTGPHVFLSAFLFELFDYFCVKKLRIKLKVGEGELVIKKANEKGREKMRGRIQESWMRMEEEW